jgi:hypothetical protein
MLLRDRIHFCWQNKISQLQRIQQMENVLKPSLNTSDQCHIFNVVENSSRNIFNKQKAIHSHIFSWLHDQQNRVSSAPASESTNFVLSLSKHTHTDSEEAVLAKDLSFLVTYPHSILDMTCAVESVVPKLHRLWVWNSDGRSGPC